MVGYAMKAKRKGAVTPGKAKSRDTSAALGLTNINPAGFYCSNTLEIDKIKI
jgi:hypothetical protein